MIKYLKKLGLALVNLGLDPYTINDKLSDINERLIQINSVLARIDTKHDTLSAMDITPSNGQYIGDTSADVPDTNTTEVEQAEDLANNTANVYTANPYLVINFLDGLLRDIENLQRTESSVELESLHRRASMVRNNVFHNTSLINSAYQIRAEFEALRTRLFSLNTVTEASQRIMQTGIQPRQNNVEERRAIIQPFQRAFDEPGLAITEIEGTRGDAAVVAALNAQNNRNYPAESIDNRNIDPAL